MIKVLHVIDHLGSGGAQTVLLNLLKFRNQQDFSYTVACLHGKGGVAAELEAIGVPVVSLSPGKLPPLYVPNLAGLLLKERFDIVHCHLFGANWLARPIAALCGQKTIFAHDHCNDALRERLGPFLIDRLTNLLSCKILAVSRSTREFLLRQEGISDEVVEYFTNGVDVDAFGPPSREARAGFRVRWGLKPEDFVVGGIGRLVPQKDFTTFLRAAALVVEKSPEARFVIFGEGPEEAELKALAVRLGLEERVQFAGYVGDRQAVYGAIDLLLLTSRYEGTPMVLLEAMAAGVPICATGVDGTAEILTSGETALLFPPADPQAAAEAILEMQNQPVAQKLSLAARVRAQADFSAKSLCLRLEDLYRKTLPVAPNG
ncbi:hypothetical protein DB345_06840 [Spartobacteria bacterium LR76]|nr:hypothetical protein DB345_06840 [Spartobacteria bacterium LR76]